MGKWINLVLFLQYLHKKYLWEYLFIKLNTKLYVTLSMPAPHVIAAAAAIKKLGGLSAVIQNSFFERESINQLIYCDIQFLFSNDNLLEKLQKALVKYNVAAGYFRDFTFSEYRICPLIILELLFITCPIAEPSIGSPNLKGGL